MNKIDREIAKVEKFYKKPRKVETWNLDFNIIQFLVPRLRLFKELSQEIIEYDYTIVDKILEGFELYLSVDDWETGDMIKNMEKVDKSMKIFSEHWREFWW